MECGFQYEKVCDLVMAYAMGCAMAYEMKCEMEKGYAMACETDWECVKGYDSLYEMEYVREKEYD
jgi:hypothetical protein